MLGPRQNALLCISYFKSHGMCPKKAIHFKALSNERFFTYAVEKAYLS